MSKSLILLTLFITSIIEAADFEAIKFVGADGCIACHKEQADAWQGSHHDLAMQNASTKSVLGDFNNIKFKQFSNGVSPNTKDFVCLKRPELAIMSQ